MFITTVVVSVLLSALLFVSAAGKLARQERQLVTMRRVGFPEDKLWLLAAAEIAGGVGLVAGLSWWPIGVAAAIGVIAYFLGAIASHLRVHDRNVTAPAVPLLFAVVALVLRLLTS